MTTQDKEAVEAAEEFAGYRHGAGLNKAGGTWIQDDRAIAFKAGVEWQKQRTVDILKEPPPLGYGMDWYIEKITGIKQRENPVNGELEGDD